MRLSWVVRWLVVDWAVVIRKVGGEVGGWKGYKVRSGEGIKERNRRGDMKGEAQNICIISV